MLWNWRLVVQFPFWAILLPWMFFHYTLQLHGILQYFLLQEMARIDPPNQKTRNAKVSTFWRFPPNAKNSCREPCLLPASTKFEILGTTLLHTVVNSLQTKQHKTNQKPMQSRRFQAIFEVNLWTEHSVCPGKIYWPVRRGMTECFASYWLIGQSREPRDLTCWFRLPTHLLSSETRWIILNWLVPGVCSCEYALWVCVLDFGLGSSFFWDMALQSWICFHHWNSILIIPRRSLTPLSFLPSITVMGMRPFQWMFLVPALSKLFWLKT